MFKKILIIGASLFFLAKAESQNYVSIMDVGTSMLIGGYSNGEWIYGDQFQRKVKGGEQYKLYSLNGYLGTISGSVPETFGDPCNDTYSINHSYKMKNVNENEYITGIACSWDAYPKKLVSLSTTQATYTDITSNLLKANGILHPKVEINSVIKTDIEDDGVDEVFICATYFKNSIMPGEITAGDYSFVYLRKIINGKVENIIIEGNFFPEVLDTQIAYRLKLCNILDLNNDGKLEFIIFGEYYEGYGFNVYKLQENKPVLILAASCGA